MNLSQEIHLSISEPEDETTLPYKNEIHVRGELILFCFSTFKLKYFAYLSLQPSIYDKVYDVMYHVSTKMHVIVCHFLGSGKRKRGQIRENSDNW